MAVDAAFDDSKMFMDEDGNPREFDMYDPDVSEREVERLRVRLEAAPTGVSHHDEG